MVNVALVGCGGIGLAHLRAYAQLPCAKLVACVDRDLEKARAAAQMCGATALSDIADLPTSVQGVSLVTPPYTHYALVKELLNAGFHVFAEKPLTMDTDEAHELVDLSQQRALNLMVGFKMRFEPVFAEAKPLLAEIGELRSVSAVKQQPYHPHPGHNWIPDVGAMYELSVHEFDLIHWLTQLPPREVLSAQLLHRRGWPREDAFFLTVQYGSDVVGQLQGMYADDSKFLYRDLTLTFLGERGYLRIERPDRIVVHTDEYRTVAVDKSKANAFAEELGHFCRVINGEEPNTMDGRYGLWTTALVEAANRAFEQNAPATVPIDG